MEGVDQMFVKGLVPEHALLDSVPETFLDADDRELIIYTNERQVRYTITEGPTKGTLVKVVGVVHPEASGVVVVKDTNGVTYIGPHYLLKKYRRRHRHSHSGGFRKARKIRKTRRLRK
jgi:hypothetical protein